MGISFGGGVDGRQVGLEMWGAVFGAGVMVRLWGCMEGQEQEKVWEHLDHLSEGCLLKRFCRNQ